MKGLVAALICLALLNVVMLPAAGAEASSGWGAEERLSVQHPTWVTDLEVDVSEGGQAIAAWDCYDSAEVRTSSWVAMYDPEKGWSDGSMLDSASFSSYTQNVEINANGMAMVAWARATGGFVYPMVAVYDAEEGWQEPVMLSTDQATHIYSMDVSLNDQGQAVVAWDATIGTSNDVLVSYYTPASGWGSASHLIYSDKMQSDTMVGIDDQGGAVVVWRERVEVPGQPDRGQFRFSAYSNATGWSAESTVNGEDVGLGSPSAHMDMDGQGRVLLAYGCRNTTSNSYDVHSTYYNNSIWQPPVVLSREDGKESNCPDVSLAKDGWGMVVWAGWNGSINEYQYREFDGGAFGPIGVIPQMPVDGMNWPYIDVSDGKQVIATTEVRLDGESVDHAYAVRYSPSTGWSEWERLDKGSLTSVYFLVRGGVDREGRAVVAWISYDDASNKDRSIWTSSYAVEAVEAEISVDVEDTGAAEIQASVDDLRGQLTLAIAAAVAAMALAAISLVLLIRKRRAE